MNDLDAAEKFIDDELDLFATTGRRGPFAAHVQGLLATKRCLIKLRESTGDTRAQIALRYIPKPIPECFQPKIPIAS